MSPILSVSDAEEVTETYVVETPSSVTMEEPPTFPMEVVTHSPNNTNDNTNALSYNQPLAIVGPPTSYDVVPMSVSNAMVVVTRSRDTQVFRLTSAALYVGSRTWCTSRERVLGAFYEANARNYFT